MPFTGVMNRHWFTRELTQLLHLANRHDQPLCLAVVRVDHFQQINAQYSHAAGERILSRLGKHLQLQLRHEDLVARWEGEAFVVGMYATTKQNGEQRLTEILESLQQEEFSKSDRSELRVTFSVGVAQYYQDGADPQVLYQVASSVIRPISLQRLSHLPSTAPRRVGSDRACSDHAKLARRVPNAELNVVYLTAINL